MPPLISKHSFQFSSACLWNYYPGLLPQELATLLTSDTLSGARSGAASTIGVDDEEEEELAAMVCASVTNEEEQQLQASVTAIDDAYADRLVGTLYLLLLPYVALSAALSLTIALRMWHETFLNLFSLLDSSSCVPYFSRACVVQQ